MWEEKTGGKKHRGGESTVQEILRRQNTAQC